MKVHVVIGLYGLLLEETQVYADKTKALARGEELAKEYDCERHEDLKCEGPDFFATDAEGVNEVHVRCDLEVIQ